MTKKYKSPITGDVITGEDSYGVNWLEVLEPNLLNAAQWALETEYHPKCLTKLKLANSLINFDAYAQSILRSYWDYISDPWHDSKIEEAKNLKSDEIIDFSGNVKVKSLNIECCTCKFSSITYNNLNVQSAVVTLDNVLVLDKLYINSDFAEGNVTVVEGTSVIINCSVNNLNVSYINKRRLFEH